MKKILIALLLIFTITTSCYALNIVDAMTCKKVFLRANHTIVLVNRLTGQVRYKLLKQGKWMLLEGVEKNLYQSMYNAQVAIDLQYRRQ
jgi:hypothetical protein